MQLKRIWTVAPARGVRSGAPVRGARATAYSGFTLVELMVTLAVAAVLLVIAVPSFRSLTLSNRLSTAAGDLVASMNTARMEAIKANASAQFCSNSTTLNTSSALGSTCGTQSGAVVLATGSNAKLVRSAPDLASGGVQLKGDVLALRYGGDGLARVPGSSAPATSSTVADVCVSQSSLGSDNHRVISITSGSIIETTTKSGACP